MTILWKCPKCGFEISDYQHQRYLEDGFCPDCYLIRFNVTGYRDFIKEEERNEKQKPGQMD